MNIDEMLHIINNFFKNPVSFKTPFKKQFSNIINESKKKKIYDLYINNVLNANNNYNDIEKIVINKLLKDFKHFKIAFDIYINDYVNQMKISTFSPDLYELYNEYEVHYLSFNFLTLHNYNSIVKEQDKVIFTHGYTHEIGDNYEIDEKYYKKSIVIGIPDDSFDDERYIEFQKFFQRIMYKNESITKDSIVDYSKIVIFGHSLHKLDKTILKIAFDATSNNRIMEIWYKDQQDMKNKIMRILEWYNKEEFIYKVSQNIIVFKKLLQPISEDLSMNDIKIIINENKAKREIWQY